ncbi:hypothetical protein [Cupriavidus metallidurans]|uniref:hypothetical protein n=1 Tax=Cupriavidus metallidurans TaxID=119219 RepID=UPI001F1FA6C6|nr:hypothetical protein [Cupriavidus metallidurans]
MTIAIVGSHRTGKSTLAADYSAATGVPFVRTSASGTFERLGLSPKVDLPIEQRIAVQNARWTWPHTCLLTCNAQPASTGRTWGTPSRTS